MTVGRRICAFVAFKGFAHAKQRLARDFSARFRERLAQAMLQDVLTALQAVTELAGIAIITSDEAAASAINRAMRTAW